VQFRSGKEPVLFLKNPDGISGEAGERCWIVSPNCMRFNTRISAT
jgi:hypothetical protein